MFRRKGCKSMTRTEHSAVVPLWSDMSSQERGLVADFAQMVVELREPWQIWPSMLARLQEFIGFDAGYIGASWRNSSEGRGAVADHDEPFLRKNLGRYLAEIHPEEVALYTDRSRVHHDVWSRERQNELAVFRELLNPTGMRHMIVRTSIRHGNIAGFNLERRSDSFPFSERDLHLVDLAAPFLHMAEVLSLEAPSEELPAEMAATYGLTAREVAFVTLAAKGLTNGEIALLNGISHNTVRNTLVRIFEKVGVSNRAELAYTAMRKQGTAPTIPPRAAPVADDGLQAFAKRVERASTLAPANRPPRPVIPLTSIVYTAPVLAAAP